MFKKRLLRMLISLIVTLSMVTSMPITVTANQMTQGGFTFEFLNGQMTITGFNGGGSIQIPAVAPDGRWVTAIGQRVFENANLSNVSFEHPSYIHTIGSDAFRRADINNITLPNSITYIGDNAFEDVHTLTSINLPPNLEIIRSRAFRGTSLTEITIPSSVRMIGNEAFRGTDLGVAHFLHSDGRDVSLGTGVFDHVNVNFWITFPPNASHFGSNWYPPHPSYPSNVQPGPLSEFTFEYLTGNNIMITGLRSNSTLLTANRIEIPSSIGDRTVRRIQSRAFENRSNLRYVVIPNTVHTIDGQAFNNNSQLRNVYLMHTNANNVDHIPSNAFAGSHSTFSIIFQHNASNFTTPTWRGHPARSDAANLSEFEFTYLTGNNIMITGLRANSPLLNSEMIEIPPTIGDRTVRRIQSRAFENRSNLRYVVIPSTVHTIDGQAFNNNSQLRNVFFMHTNANTVDHVPSNAFAGSHSTFSIVFQHTASNFTTPTWRGHPARSDAPHTTDFTFSYLTGNNIMITGLSSNSQLLTASRIEIPPTIGDRTVRRIQSGAFENRSNLRYVVIPSTVHTIDGQAFNNNNQLRNAYFMHTNANNVDHLPSNAFSGSHSTFSIVFQQNASNFTTPTWRGFPARPDTTTTDVDSDWIWTPLTGNNIMITGFHANSGHHTAERIDIPTHIDGRVVQRIQARTFDHLPNLRTVVIPDTVRVIDARAFNYNTQLRAAYFRHTNGENVTLGSNAFAGSHSSFTIYFPYGASGFTTPTWRGFPAQPEYIEGIWEFTPLGGAGNEAMITRFNGTASVVTIPTILDGRRVSYIGNEVFRNNNTITEIIFPDTIVSVATNAVLNAPNLRIARLHHTYADTLDMSGLAFVNVHADFTIIFPADSEGFTTPLWAGFPAEPDLIGANWEYSISGGVATIVRYRGEEVHVEIPAYIGGSPVRIIASEAFRDNNVIERVTIPASVNTVQPNAFYNCVNLYAARLMHTNANQLTNFPQDAFVGVSTAFRLIYTANTPGFTTPTWRGYFTEPHSEDLIIRYGYFDYIIQRVPSPGMAAATRDEVVIVRYRGESREVEIPSTIDIFPVTGLGNFAFLQNRNLRVVTIPASVTDIGHSTFLGAAYLNAARFLHSNGASVTLGANTFRYTADDFAILYPVTATGFSTPTWRSWPARPDTGTTPQPDPTPTPTPSPTPTPTPTPTPPADPPLIPPPGAHNNPFITTTRTLDQHSNFLTREDNYVLTAPIFRLEPFAPNPQFSTSYVMVRVIADILGLGWSFNPDTSTATFTGYNMDNQFIVMELTINSTTMRVNGIPREVRASAGPVPAISRGGRLFVPVAVFQEVFGVTIQWNPANQTVTVNP